MTSNKVLLAVAAPISDAVYRPINTDATSLAAITTLSMFSDKVIAAADIPLIAFSAAGATSLPISTAAVLAALPSNCIWAENVLLATTDSSNNAVVSSSSAF